jgi:hypothetical protein
LNRPTQLESRIEISRREVLMTLAATGVALTASSILPSTWSKPVVEGGVLSAHAQSSQCFDSLEVKGSACSEDVECPEGYDFRLDYIFTPKSLIPENIDIVKMDCECADLQITYTNPQPGVLSIYLSIKLIDGFCICTFGFRIQFTNGCVFNPSSQHMKKYRFEKGKLMME